jgi:uncharacterized protein (TIGR02646 family)
MRGERPPWVKWYKTASWAKLRLKQLSRSPLCCFCKKKGIITEGNTVDHIKPHKGNMEKFFDLNNLQTLCKSCHSSTKQRFEKSGEFGCDSEGIVPSWK